MWLQLDAASHYAQIWIGRGPIAWPACSPDLTFPDFYLWGYIKNVVFEPELMTREDMIEQIKMACRTIPRTVLLRTARHLAERIRLCIRANGNNFEQFLR
ncbi:hypothetical protein ACFW04_012388 [Cataglyphis niger]